MAKAKGIINFCSIELENRQDLFFEDERSLLVLIDSIDTVSAASCLMPKDSWKILSSILKHLSARYSTEYFLYENPHGLFFDAGTEHIYANSGMELLQLKNERLQTEIETARLQEKYIEISRRIKKLNSLEPFHAMNVFYEIGGE